jgi:hypothetical protein
VGGGEGIGKAAGVAPAHPAGGGGGQLTRRGLRVREANKQSGQGGAQEHELKRRKREGEGV